MENTPILQKIKKLLALSKSANEHEAALAAAHAQRLLSEHNLAMADVGDTTPPEKADCQATPSTKAPPKWVVALAGVVAVAFDCRVVRFRAESKLVFVGVGPDPQVACFTYQFLLGRLKKLSSAYIRNQFQGRVVAGTIKEQFRRSYLLGAVATISQRLKDQKQQTPVTSMALVPIKNGLIQRTINDMGTIKTLRQRRAKVFSSAYEKGAADAQSLHIQQGLPTASPAKQLPT